MRAWRIPNSRRGLPMWLAQHSWSADFTRFIAENRGKVVPIAGLHGLLGFGGSLTTRRSFLLEFANGSMVQELQLGVSGYKVVNRD
jgi:hypothetical protein